VPEATATPKPGGVTNSFSEFRVTAIRDTGMPDFTNIVALRWPGYKIEGSGPIAVVLHCDQRIVLCDFPMFAGTIKAESCSRHCNQRSNPAWHIVRELNAPPVQTPYRPKPGIAKIRAMMAAE
jgi:hypothetical protein